MMRKGKVVKTNGFNKTMNGRQVENEAKRMQRKLKGH
jgi:hypothetical protein